jgi:hypothetical protein
MDDICAL